MERIEPRLPTRERVSEMAPAPRPTAPATQASHAPAPRPMPPVAQPTAPPAQRQWIQLRLRRSQRTAGLMSSKVVFTLDARADLAAAARSLIEKYRLGPLVVYDSQARTKHNEVAAAHFQSGGSARGVGGHLAGLARGLASAAMASMTLRITVGSLMSGHHIECKDLHELLGAEEAIAQACESVKGYLEVAETFDGRELLIGF